ncbi:MAG: hypothetical protein LCH26_04520 [Proteobacteria bacterium]|nr:hypothetical protein [Pseudomonadota bacterium]
MNGVIGLNPTHLMLFPFMSGGAHIPDHQTRTEPGKVAKVLTKDSQDLV